MPQDSGESPEREAHAGYGLPTRFGGLRQLGAGSMGAVLAARDRELDRPVAVKLGPDKGHTKLRRRFLEEARALAALHHPNVLAIYDHGEGPRGVSLVTELLEGPDLAGAGSLEDPLGIMLELADGLDALHASGLVHRDVKPENIVLDGGTRPVLVDLGLVLDPDRTRITRTGAFVGTPGFASPEALRGQEVDARADWWGWGATLFWLLEGRPPLEEADFERLRKGGALAPPRLENTPPGSPAGRVLRAVLEPDPRRRLASGAAARTLAEARPPGTRTLARARGEDLGGGVGALGADADARVEAPPPLLEVADLGVFLAGLAAGALWLAL